MQLLGIHHLTAITADTAVNHDFYTRVLGLRLVKKTVNQDDVSAYHLFYADGKATPGSDITFFDWPMPRETRGTHSITRTGFRVSGEANVKWWRERLTQEGVSVGDVHERDGRATIDFEDLEGQRLSISDDGGRGQGHPWDRSPVTADRQIRGLGPITISVPDLAGTHEVLTQVMNMRPARQYPQPENPQHLVHVYEMGEGGAAAELRVAVQPFLAPGEQGAGGVHHVAFRVPNEDEYHAWTKRLREFRIPSSGEVDRFYFRSLYFREPNGILFELATDGPGFATDEPEETMGEKLSLPPFLEPQRKQIEANLKPLR